MWNYGLDRPYSQKEEEQFIPAGMKRSPSDIVCDSQITEETHYLHRRSSSKPDNDLDKQQV
jgi:hypothetical protein